MNFTWLQYFYEVGKCGSFTDAARELHITQPALSKAVMALEEEIGHKLFLRTKLGVVFTEFGKRFYRQTGVLLREYNKLMSMHDVGEAIRIGIPPTMGYCYIPKTIRIAGEMGLPEIEWKESGSAKLEEMMLSGALEAIIIPKEMATHLDMAEYISLTRVQEVLCVSVENRLAREERITVEMIEDENFILFSPDYNQNLPYEELFDHAGFYPKKRTFTSQLSTVFDVIDKNMAIAILIDAVFKNDKEKYRIKGIPLEPTYTLELVLAWNKKSLPKKLKSMMRELGKQLVESM